MRPGISIDPGLPAGIALWEGHRLQQFDTINARIRSMNYIDRALVSVAEISYLMPEGGWLAIEVPEYWSGSAKSYAALTGDDLAKLTMLCGMIVHAAAIRGLEIFMYKPREWKGQLPKRVARVRIERVLGAQAFKSDHEWEAAGIGLHHLRGSL